MIVGTYVMKFFFSFNTFLRNIIATMFIQNPYLYLYIGIGPKWNFIETFLNYDSSTKKKNFLKAQILTDKYL